MPAWNNLLHWFQQFVDNHKTENSVELIANLMKTYGETGCRISLKAHVFDVNVNEFTKDMGAHQEEQKLENNWLCLETRPTHVISLDLCICEQESDFFKI